MNLKRITQSRYFFYIVLSSLMGFLSWLFMGLLESSPGVYYKNYFKFLFALLWIYYPLAFYLYELKERQTRTQKVLIWDIKNILNNRYFFYITFNLVLGLIVWLVNGFVEASPIEYYLNHKATLFISLWLAYPFVFYAYEEKRAHSLT